MGGLGNGRRGGRAPSLMIASLITCILVLGFKYWVSSSRNLELQVGEHTHVFFCLMKAGFVSFCYVHKENSDLSFPCCEISLKYVLVAVVTSCFMCLPHPAVLFTVFMILIRIVKTSSLH